jgi:hypothetical protein
MNNGNTSIHDRELERLADGEFSPMALRDLFGRLDQTEDGWKRAALALVEAQALRTACRSVLAPPPAVVRAEPRRQPTSQPVRGRRELFAVAVAVLLTCGLGWWSIPSTPWVDPVSVPMAQALPANEEPPALVQAVQMTFSGADGEWSEPVTAPVIDADDPAALPWLTARPAFSDAVREKLASEGQRIHQQQRWVPVELADGRVGVVPVTDLVVAPARPSDYQ